MNLRRGDRVKVRLNTSYRYYLDELEGFVTAIYHHGAVVALGSDPAGLQKTVVTGGHVGPVVPPPVQRLFQFNELERLD